ncbi:MAG: sulfatase-like hydrolase/transferase [Acidimicrobiales bacterium]
MTVPPVRSLLGHGAAVLGLTSFAIAQPAYDILGSNAEFFVAHRASAGQIVGWSLVAYLMPPIGICVVVGLLGLWRRTVARATLAVVGGVLGSVAVLQALPGELQTRTVIYVGLFAVMAVLVALAFLRTTWMASFWRVMGMISPLLVASFLFMSPVSDLVFSGDVTVTGVGAVRSDDVVFVVLDEFSLASIIDEQGRLDGSKAPNLAALAERASFYADATTVSPETARSVPSILSGVTAAEGQLPVASEFPQNLFTLLAPSHEMVVDEIVTRLCPPAACTSDSDGSTADMYDDARVVYLHTLLPTSWASRWLPDISTQWAGFGDDVEVPDPPTASEPSFIRVQDEVADDQAARAERFIEQLAEPGDDPQLHYAHLAVPHVPYVYLPSGQRYNGNRLDGLADGVWSDDAAAAEVAEFRYQLQVEYVDGLIGAMVEAMEASGRFDESMIVLVSDHGVSNRASTPRRIPTEETLGDIAWIPMLVKQPGQQRGEEIDTPALTIDLVPTVADVMGIELVEPVDGVSLADGPRPPMERRLVGHEQWVLDRESQLLAAAARSRTIVPAGQAPSESYGWGPLLGRPGEPVEGWPTSERVEAVLSPDRLDLLAVVDVDSPFVPALFQASVEGLEPGDHVAVFVDDVLAGSGPIRADGTGLIVMLDPVVLVDGRNQIGAALVTDDGLLAIEVVDQSPYELDLEDGEVVRVRSSDGGEWSTLTPAAGAIDVRPGNRENDPALLSGWAASCAGGEPVAVDLLLLADGFLVPTRFDRLSRPDIPCLEEPADVGFSLHVAPSLESEPLTVVALFDDGTFTVLE